MRKYAIVAIADASEEVETIAVVDVLRRAGVEVVIASVTTKEIVCAKATHLVADKMIDEVSDSKFDLIYLPGGMPGAEYLRDSRALTDMLLKQQQAGRLIAAICAAPLVVLQHHQLLAGRPATCHPSLAEKLPNWQVDKIVVSDNIITSQGPGTALSLGLKLAELLVSKEVAEQVAAGMVIA